MEYEVSAVSCRVSQSDLTYEWIDPSGRATDQGKFLKIAQIELHKFLDCGACQPW